MFGQNMINGRQQYMNKKDQALKMAMRFAKSNILTRISGLHGENPLTGQEVFDACKEALEQEPAQEPVAWINEDELPDDYPYDEMFKHSEIVYGVRVFPVYSPKHQWQGLTDDEQSNIFKNQLGHDCSCDPHYFYLAIEQALKEKNT